MTIILFSFFKKYRVNLFFLILLFPLFSLAQNVNPIDSTIKSSSNDSNKQSPNDSNNQSSKDTNVISVDSIVKVVLSKILEKDTISKSRNGKILLKDTIVNIYNENGTIAKKIIIDSVKMNIIAGKITRYSLQIYSLKSLYRNFGTPISLNTLGIRQNLYKKSKYRLRDIDSSNNMYILPNEILRYDNMDSYVPDDNYDILLTKVKGYQDLTTNNNLNSIIKVALYTDLIGLLGRKPNGLLNTDISGKFFVNTRNSGNIDLTLLSFIEPNIVLSKFDSKFKSIDSTYILPGLNNEKDTIDRLRLMQTAWLKASLKFNCFVIRTYSDQYFQLNVGASINVVNADSLFKKQQNTDLIYFDYFIEPVYLVNRVRNFGMEISMKFIIQHLADREPFSNNTWKKVFNPHIAFSYFANNDPSSQLFLRFDYFAGHQISDNNFYQLEFGWKTDLKL